jgi:hypothetical protein
MRIKPIAVSLCFLLIIFCCQSCAAKKKKTIEIFGGMPIPGVGLSIDASYDPRLDNLAPGYRVLNVAMVNESFNMVTLNPKKDKWWITTGTKKRKKKHDVIWDLRSADSQAWHQIPERARGLVGYPLILAIGARQVVDIFVPEKIPLEEFTELIIYFDSLQATVKVMTRQ